MASKTKTIASRQHIIVAVEPGRARFHQLDADISMHSRMSLFFYRAKDGSLPGFTMHPRKPRESGTLRDSKRLQDGAKRGCAPRPRNRC